MALEGSSSASACLNSCRWLLKVSRLPQLAWVFVGVAGLATPPREVEEAARLEEKPRFG